MAHGTDNVFINHIHEDDGRLDKLNGFLKAWWADDPPLTGYKGRCPGILEEALLALRSGSPLYLAGGFGGPAELVAEAVTGGTLYPLTLAEQEKEQGDNSLSGFRPLVGRARRPSR